ncbi:MAG: DUF4926 domain-containing protein [Cyanobacteria bacterium]|nr:DUF4926 domain-containing protein [Cyanobacteriota bacterium]
MKVDLFQEVSLCRDFPQYSLCVGDIATVVDFIPHPNGGEEGCILEISNALGEFLNVAIVPISAVTLLRSDDVMMIRSLAKTS